MARWGSTDFKQLQELADRINQFNNFDKDAFCREAANELAQRLYAMVVKKTPTGKKPKFDAPKTAKVTGASGKSKSFLTKEGAILQQYWAGYQGGELKKAWKVLSVQKVGNEYVCEIINPTKYAPYVEYGHRQSPGRYVPQLGKQLKAAWVEGRFMMTISEKKIQSLAPKFLEKELQKKLEEIINGQ